MMNCSSTTQKELPLDVLGKIGERLELLDFLRFGGVCSSWRIVQTTVPSLQPKSQIPWLMLYSNDHDNNNNNNNVVDFFSLVESKTYKFQLPEAMRGFGHFIGSSEGFLISAHRESGNLQAVNPLTGQQLPLPPTSTLFPYFKMRPWHRFHKAIVCPSTQAVVVCYGKDTNLAFAPSGGQEDTWTTLETLMCENDEWRCLFKYGMFDDMIFHKGKLHAIDFTGTLYVYDLCSSTRPCFRTRPGPLDHEFENFKRYLVDDPTTADLYLIFRDSDHSTHSDKPECCTFDGDSGPWSFFNRTVIFKVFKLDTYSYRWNEIHALLGDVSLFLGFNTSLSLSPKDFPSLKSNRIYFTDDVAVSKVDLRPSNGLVGDMGVFSLEDGSVEPLSISDDVLRRLNWPPPIWFSPTWKRV